MNTYDIEVSIFFFPTDEKETSKIALNIKSKTSTGHDNISNKIVKEIIPYITLALTHIFNVSLETGIVPDIYKTA